MNVKMFQGVLFLICTVLVSSYALAGGLNTMSPDAVKAALSGKTCDGEHHRKDFEYKIYFNPDGTFKRKTQYGSKHSGKWRFDGGKHCMYFNHIDKEFCRAVVDNGSGSYSKYKEKRNGSFIKITTLKNCKPGSTL